ncbi:hypothetical protein F5Y13DRAFT_155330 [Hypoxylon sp. FL1857]|nr:hypothetical protein F5Y13DRAFT_155330 [Hypoxylon sp. FL1857]
MSEMDIDSGPSKPQAVEIDSDGDTTATTNANNNDPDPIVASYDVYTNPQLPENRKLLVLQHPNKQGPVRNAYARISEVRLKNKSGFIEVDVPMSHGHADYDRDKGLRWGSALARSMGAKNGGTHGLAGGFGVGVPTRGAAGGAGRGGANRQNDLEREISMLDWNEAVRQDKVLRTQTLGGQFAIEKETNCRWMIGVFKGDQLHLTPATSLINLRPQLHHLDAYAEQERLSRPREAPAAGPSSGAGAAGKEGAAAGTGPQGGPGAAKAIHMSIKSANSGDADVTVDTMERRLRQVQTEQWIKLQYENEYSEKTWNMFTNSLVYPRAKNVDISKFGKDDKDKGKGKEKEEKDEEKEAAKEDDNTPLAYKSQWAEDEFLQAVSGLKDNQQGDANPLGDDEVEIKAEVINQGPIDAAKKPIAARGKGKAAATPAAASTAKKAVRGKSVAFKE